MWQVVVLFLVSSVMSLAEDIFSDDVDYKNQDAQIEYDPNFEDDFNDIETTDNKSFGKNLIVISNDLWGSKDIVRREKSISVLVGKENIASTYHFLFFPEGRFLFSNGFGHLGLPLRFPVYDNYSGRGRSVGFVKAETLIMPRRQDFRSFWDVDKVVRHFELGEPFGPYFFRLSRAHGVTLGQGDLLIDMSPYGLYDRDVLFLTGEASFDFMRVEGFIGPMFRAEMIGLSSRFTPFSYLAAMPFIENINVDVTYVNDFLAPNKPHKENAFYVLNSDRRTVKRDTGTAQGLSLGALTEFVPINWLSLKPYVSYSHLWLTSIGEKRNEVLGTMESSWSYGAGIHFGHDATIYFTPGEKKSVLLFKSEGRLFSSKYYPGYFGETYFVDRLVLNEPGNTTLGKVPITKSEYVSAGNDGSFRFGYLFLLGYAYDEVVSMKIGYENARSLADGAMLPPMRKLHFLVGIWGLDVVKFHLGYEATSIAEIAELFDFEKSRALLSLRGQLKLNRFLYFDAWIKHAFGINDMFISKATQNSEHVYLSNLAETRSLNFGLGLEFAMTF